MIEKAAPELMGDRHFEVKKNYVEFSVPLEVYDKIMEWLRLGDDTVLCDQYTQGLSIMGTSKKGKIVLLNWREQRAYIARGGGPGDN